jgi:hypothetical protein
MDSEDQDRDTHYDRAGKCKTGQARTINKLQPLDETHQRTKTDLPKPATKTPLCKIEKTHDPMAGRRLCASGQEQREEKTQQEIEGGGVQSKSSVCHKLKDKERVLDFFVQPMDSCLIIVCPCVVLLIFDLVSFFTCISLPAGVWHTRSAPLLVYLSASISDPLFSLISRIPYPLSRIPYYVSPYPLLIPYLLSFTPYPLSRIPRPLSIAHYPLSLITYNLYLIPYTLYLIPYTLYLIPYTLSRIPYYPLPLIPYPLSLIPYPLALILYPLSPSQSRSRFQFQFLFLFLSIPIPMLTQYNTSTIPWLHLVLRYYSTLVLVHYHKLVPVNHYTIARHIPETRNY